ncbi:MAG: hypothetical protein NZ583_07530 [Desulfobacterota bacterium]|nr:hypothetical protein [Thermodesulfobacteriota bacterium]
MNAYVPEHIYPYVTSILKGEAFFFKPFLWYETSGLVFVVGYPISGNFDREVFLCLIENLRRERPHSKVSAILPYPLQDTKPKSSDFYYILDLREVRISQKTKNMIKRAKREVTFELQKDLTIDHLRLIDEFLKEKLLNPQMSKIYRQISAYVEKSDHSTIISAYDKKGSLIAFSIVDTSSSDYAFYMFNIRTKKDYVPGTSDLLFEVMIDLSKAESKRFINLGLKINEGIGFFKEKWGAKPHLPYYLYEWEANKKPMDLLLEKLV